MATIKFISGGAAGADTVWKNELQKETKHTFVDITAADYDKLTPAEKQKVENEYLEVVRILGRKILPANTYTGKLVRRSMLQTDYSDSVIAITELENNNKTVKGGTAYAVVRAILQNKPITLFEQNEQKWYSWDCRQKKFLAIDKAPAFTKATAVIGARKINAAGIMAIRNCIHYNRQKLQQDRTKTIIKMYTSYYAGPKIKDKNLQLVQISVSLPKDMRYRKDIWNFDEAKPDWNTVDKIKKGIYTEGDYYAEYMRKLFNHKREIADKLVHFYHQANGKDIVFLCYEAPDKFCHRHIFAEFCNKLFTNLNIQEL